MQTREQLAIRTELAARKSKLEAQMAMENLDEIISFGVERGMIKEYGFGFLFDLDAVIYDYGRDLYERNTPMEVVVQKTGLDWTIVHSMCAAVDASRARAQDRAEIERVCVPGALNKRIDQTKISVRAYNLLSSHGVRVIGDVLRFGMTELKKLDGVGPKVYADITKMLADHKVSLMA